MEKYIHPNAIISSNLLRFSVLLTAVAYYLFNDRKSFFDIMAILILIFLLIGAAYLIRKGNNWIRWVLMVLSISAILLDIIALRIIFKSGFIQGSFHILIDLTQSIAAVLLFLPYKPTADKSIPIETSEEG